MSSFSGFEDLIKHLLKDEKFKNTVSGDILGAIDNDKDKESVVKAALRCIFGAPQGVRTMAETKKFSHIKNKRNWQPFCQRLLNHVKDAFPSEVGELQKVSGLFANYGKFWPDCDKELSFDVEKARAASQK
jgi:hypothetical protein